MDLKEQENEKLKEQVRLVTTELDYYRKSHDLQMDKFDKKFTEFQRELTDLSEQNSMFKDKEKRYKKKINDSEVQNLEWKERCKYLQARNTELTRQVEILEGDVLSFTRAQGQM